MAKKNAMHSLWGSKARADAAERVYDVLYRAGAQVDFLTDELVSSLLDAVKPPKTALQGLTMGGVQREQTVLTPKWLIDQLGPIALDPCTTPENPTGAKHFYVGGASGFDGLKESWLHSEVIDGGLVYVNPPYNDIETWFAKCMDEAANGAKIVMLVPVRTNRAWWQGAAIDAKEVRYCRPFAFEGHAQAFPAPLCMMSWNCRIPDIQMPATKKTPARSLFL